MDKKLFRDISYGVYIVTSTNNTGCVINTLTQITSTNPVVSISLNKDNYTNQEIKKSRVFSVSILSEDTNESTIGEFGYKTSKEVDKFSKVKYENVDNIKIVTDNICGYLICNVKDIIDCGTHDLFIAEVSSAVKCENKKPMTYKYYHEELKGKSPKNAPTYIEEETTESNNSNKYQCIICGYIYDNDKEKIKFEDLPDDWKCPRCGVGKDKFKKI